MFGNERVLDGVLVVEEMVYVVRAGMRANMSEWTGSRESEDV